MLALPAPAVPMKTVVSVSGGLGSAYALKAAIETYGRENVIALFADVKGTGASHSWSDLPALEGLLQERYGGESADTYRFVWQLSHALDIPIERIEDGRSIWAVFAETRSFRLVVGTRFFCKASDALKREAIAQWCEKNLVQGKYRMLLGMGFWESHRVHNASQYWQHRLGWPIEVASPLNMAVDNCVISEWLDKLGIEAPEAYRRGLPHNNCRAVCVQAGQNQYAEVYQNDRDTYLYGAWQEMRLRKMVGINATILKDERGGAAKPITLMEFAERVEAGDYNKRDMGGSCSCFSNADMTAFLSQAPLKAA